MSSVKRITIVIIFSAIWIDTTPVDGSDGSGGRNAYVAISSLYSVINSGSAFDNDNRIGARGFGFRLGGNMSRHWGVEMQFDWPGDFEYQFDIDDSLSGMKSFSFYTMSGNLRFRFTRGRWEPSFFAGLGIVQGKMPASTGFRGTLRYGPGVSFWIAGNFSLDFNASGTTVIDPDKAFDVYGVSLGILYRLGPQRSTRSSN